jgi:hypothetical protein
MRGLSEALAVIDEANALDPNTTVVDGVPQPLALVQGRRASHWLDRLAPDASPALQLAARAHHLRRWTIPRATYPSGRAAYLRWRRDLKDVHASALADLLPPLGVDPAVVARARDLVRKRGLGSDPETQTFEDVVCLVFLETQFVATIDKLADDDKMVDVLRKTVPKMSPAGVAAVAEADIGPRGLDLLARALGA